MPKRKSPRALSDNPGQIIQFRADELLVSQLAVIAERTRTPMGVLARQWVADRVRKEIEQDRQTLDLWYEKRLPEIERRLKSKMEAGPVQILHFLPLASDVSVDPDKVQALMSLLAPVERIDGRYEGRINLHGFITEKTYKDSSKLNGYVQFFRSGQLESVRILRQGEMKQIYGSQLDSDLIRSVWSYCTALQQLSVPLPLIVLIRFGEIQGYSLRTQQQLGSPIDVNEFTLPAIEISDWSKTARRETVAQTIKPALDVLWNASGFGKSPSYKADGIWKGPVV